MLNLKPLKWIGYIIGGAALIWVSAMLVGSFGCSSAERSQLAYEAAQAAVDAAADRFHIPTPEEAVSPLQGLLGAGGMMLVYLVRKKFFPMGKR